MINSIAASICILRNHFYHFCEEELSSLGLTGGQFYYIIFVGKHPNCYLGEVAQAMRVDCGHVTRVTAKLSQKGFLMKTQDQKDGRAWHLCLTEKGKDVYQEITQLFSRWDSMIGDALTEEEKLELAQLLMKLSQKAGENDV